MHISNISGQCSNFYFQDSSKVRPATSAPPTKDFTTEGPTSAEYITIDAGKRQNMTQKLTTMMPTTVQSTSQGFATTDIVSLQSSTENITGSTKLSESNK